MTTYLLLAVAIALGTGALIYRRSRARRSHDKQHLSNVLGPARVPPDSSPAFEFLLESHRKDPITTRVDALQRLQAFRKSISNMEE